MKRMKGTKSSRVKVNTLKFLNEGLTNLKMRRERERDDVIINESQELTCVFKPTVFL